MSICSQEMFNQFETELTTEFMSENVQSEMFKTCQKMHMALVMV